MWCMGNYVLGGWTTDSELSPSALGLWSFSGSRRPKNLLFTSVRASDQGRVREESVADSRRTASEHKEVSYLSALFLGLRECSMIAS
jgi:hypothetical protein